MKVFVTGGNGFLGLNIVRALVEAGHEVTALTRANSNTTYLDQFSVQTVEGELTDLQWLTKTLTGMDAVIHTAGITGCKKSEFPKLVKVNADSTRTMCEASLAANIQRFVFTSTTSTVGAGNHRVVADENSPLRGFRAKNPYGISKQIAERHVIDATNKGLNTIILNPAEVVGEFDYNLQWGRIILAVAFNQLPFVPPGGASFCHAAEVGRAHVNALTMGGTGEKYILGGVNTSIQSYIETIESQLGRRADRPGGNYWMKYCRAWMHENFPLLVREPQAVEAYRMRVFGGDYFFSSASAVKKLGYRELTLEQMVSDAIQWYQSVGIIPAKAI
jgi:dihydroflavonol-4-reductase